MRPSDATHMNTRDDPAPLNLSLDVLGSSQPFPSPGSAFIPPPVPGAHEFAVRPSSAGRKMSKKDGDDDLADPRSPPPSSANGCASIPPNASANANANARPTPDVDLATVSATSPNGVVSPTRAPLNFIRSFVPRFIMSILNIPRSLWRVLPFQDSSAPPMRDNLLSPISQMPPPPDSIYPSHDPSSDSPLSVHPNQNHRLSTTSVTSLTSSRPAPPSPAMSRRASGLSRSSSTARSRPVSGMSTGVPRSRPVSGSLQPDTLTRTPSGRRPKDVLSMSAVTTFKDQSDEATPTQTTANASLPTPTATTAMSMSMTAITTTTTTATTTTPTMTSITPTPTPATTESVLSTLIKIRDYGFAASDPRFSGQGPNVPRPNRPSYLARRLRPRSSSASLDSTSTTSSSSEDDGEGENQWEDVGTNGWGGFKWGIGRAWGFGRGFGGGGTDAGFPSRGDLDRNFGTQDQAQDQYEDEDMDMDVEEDGDEVYEQFEDDGEGEPPLLPGLYRALYAFEPEGTAEMKLEEDQMVRVIGRGGGVGWAVVVKDGLKDTGVHALVPESYLEPVRLEGDEEDV